MVEQLSTLDAVVNFTTPNNSYSLDTVYRVLVQGRTESGTVFDLPGTDLVVNAYDSYSQTVKATITGLRGNQRYWVSITAINEQGPSAASPQTMIDTPIGVPSKPEAPSSPTNGTTGAITSLVVRWNVPDASGLAITAYEMQAVNGSMGNWGTPYHPDVFAGSSSNVELVQGLAAGTWYAFRVRASNTAGWSVWSDWSGAMRVNGGTCVDSRCAMRALACEGI